MPLAVGQASVSEDEELDQLPGVCGFASELLSVELLRRPLDSARYTSFEFGRRLRESGILPSMGRVGSAHDNAAMDSTFGSMKRELAVIFGPALPTCEAARSPAFWWIEVFYNRRRRHSFCGQLAPLEFEQRWSLAATVS